MRDSPISIGIAGQTNIISRREDNLITRTKPYIGELLLALVGFIQRLTDERTHPLTEIPVKAAVAVAKNNQVLLKMMTAAAASALTASAAATTTGLGRKLIKGLPTKTRFQPAAFSRKHFLSRHTLTPSRLETILEKKTQDGQILKLILSCMPYCWVPLCKSPLY